MAMLISFSPLYLGLDVDGTDDSTRARTEQERQYDIELVPEVGHQ
jgi:hypothetical protein